MFEINEDYSIYCTRGDIGAFAVSAEIDGEEYIFKAGDGLRLKVFEKKNCDNVVLQKSFPVTEDKAGTTEVILVLDNRDTKFGDTINKPVDYWYEVELIFGETGRVVTIIGYDDDGAKIFKLFPEGKETPEDLPSPEDMPLIDKQLNAASPRPVENQAITRETLYLRGRIKELQEEHSTLINTLGMQMASVIANAAAEESRVNNLASLTEGSTTGDAELADIRADHTGVVHTNAGDAIRNMNRIVKNATRFVELGYSYVSNNWIWTNAYISDVGEEIESEHRLLSPLYESKFGNTIQVLFSKAQHVMAKQYDYDGNLIGGTDWETSGNLTIESAYGVYRFMCKNADNSELGTHSVMVYTKGMDYEANEIPANYSLVNGVVNGFVYEDNEWRVHTTPILALDGFITKVSVALGYELMVKECDHLGNIVFGLTDWQSSSFSTYGRNLVVNLRHSNNITKVSGDYCGALKVTYIPDVAKRDEHIKFYPQLATALSNNAAKIAHNATLRAGDAGEMYCVYYQDDDYTTESPTGTNEYIVVNKFNVSCPYERERIALASPKSSLGGITFDNQSIREPSLFVGDKVNVFFLAYVHGVPSYYTVTLSRNLDVESINKCTLDGKNMITTLGNIIEVDGKYYAGLGAYSSGYHGKVIVSDDLVTWTTAFELNTPITDGYCMEIALEYFKDKFHCVVRIQENSNDTNNGIFHLVYTKDGVCETSGKMNECGLSRPTLVVYGNGLYCFANKDDRDTLLILKLNYSGKFSTIYTRKYNCGIHYFSVINYADTLYMAFSTGIKKLNVAQMRDTIMFAPIEIAGYPLKTE